MKKVLFLMLFLSLWGTVCLNAQVTIGGNKEPEKFSVLELIGNGTGLRLPQLTTYQRDSLTTDAFKANPDAYGLLIFNTDTRCIEFWNSSDWISQCAPSSIDLTCGAVLSSNPPVAVGAVPSEIVGAMPTTGGTAPYTYLWQSCTGNPSVAGNWSPAAGSNTGVNYQPAALNNSTYFRRQVTDAVGATCFSNVVEIAVALVAGTITQPGQLPVGGGTVTINGTASTGGLSGSVTHRWEYCKNGCDQFANWYPVTDNSGGYSCSNDGTGLNYSSCTITSDMNIRRRDMDGEQFAVTNTVLVTVSTSNPTGTAADINVTPVTTAVCQDSPASFTVTLVPPVTSPVVYVYDSNGNEVGQKSAAPFTFTVNPPTAPETNYYVAFKGSNYDLNLPGNRKQVVIPVTKKQDPTISIVSDATNNTITSGTSVTFTATVNNLGGGTPTYEWRLGASVVQTGPNSTYNTISLSNGTVVSCVLTITGGCVTYTNATSNNVEITVSTPPSNTCEACIAKLRSYATLPAWALYYAWWSDGHCAVTEFPGIPTGNGSYGSMQVSCWDGLDFTPGGTCMPPSTSYRPACYGNR